MATLGSTKLTTNVGPIILTKTASTSRASTTTPADDPHLVTTLTAGQWIMTGYLAYYQSNANPHLLIAFTTLPAGSWCDWSAFGLHSSVSGVSGAAVWGYQGNGEAVALGGNPNVSAQLAGSFRLQSAVTIALRWSQQVSNAAATILRQDSWIKWEQAS